MEYGLLFCSDVVLEQLAQDLQDVAAELREFIQTEQAVVRQRYLARQRDLAAADQPHIRDGVVRSPEGAGRDQRRVVAGETGHAMDARGVDGFGERHRQQDGGQPAGQHRLPCTWGTQEQPRYGQNARITLTFTRATAWSGSAPLTPSHSRSTGGDQRQASASSSALASRRSAVSKPSVNQP
jgi:hypothetical protein